MRYSRDLDVRYHVDVLVAGGGPAGAAAAVFARRSGASVMLVEGSACLGGLGTTALVPAFMQFDNGVDFLAAGFGREILERMWKLGGRVAGWPSSIRLEPLKRAYDELMEEASVTYLLTTQITDVVREAGTITHAVCSGKSGMYAIEARMFIDATGDGDLCAWAGAPYEKGDASGRMMAGTLCTLWAGIDWSRVSGPDSAALDRAFEDRVFTHEDRHLSGMWRVGEHLGGGNIGHTYDVDGTDEASLTAALIDGRRRMSEYETYYRQYLAGGYSDIELVATGAALGVRESRRVMGDYVLTLDDFLSRRHFDDEIGRYCYPVDIHASDASRESHAAFEKEYTNYRYGPGESYGIPYRALLPRGVRNMLVAGRCISTDRYMQSSVRVMPGCYITGQAAGAAAALALAAGGDTRGVDAAGLRARLRQMGAFLPEDAGT